ncbi:MAG: PAS domain S-box protein [Thauera sp.]|nr:PAS domain S-box protein [Thauera sp.]
MPPHPPERSRNWRSWRQASLTTRISIFAGALTTIVLLPALLASYAALHTLMLEKLGYELEATASEARLRFEARLESDIDKLLGISRQTIFSNALSDSAGRTQYVRPTLIDLCRATPELEALFLTDFRGRVLESGCASAEASPGASALAQDAVERAATQRALAREGAGLRLRIAAPITHLPTGRHEGALGAELDLTRIFTPSTSGLAHSHALRLRDLAGTPTDHPGLSDNGRELRYLTRIAGRHGLPLAIEVVVDRELALRPIHRLVASMIVIGVAVLLLALLLSRRIAQDIGTPLAELELTAARVAAGDFDALPAPRGSPEGADRFELLANSVYRMIAGLRDTQQRLSASLATRTRQMERAEAERRLKERALASSTTGVLIVANRPGGDARVQYANPALLQMTGLPEAAILGARWPMLLFGNAPGPAPDRTVELAWRRADGARVCLELSASHVIDVESGADTHAIVLVSDVTARLRADRAQRKLLENLGEIVVEIGLDRRLHFLNKAWEKITGHAIADSLGREFPEFMHHDDLQRNLQALIALRQGEIDSHEFDCRVRCRDGGTRWLSVKLNTLREDERVTGFGGILTDITERREAAMAIAIRDRALEAVGNGISIVDMRQPDYPAIYVNRAFEQITGYARGEAIGRNCRFLRGHDHDQPEVAMLRRAIATGRPCEVTLRNYRKDGSFFWNQLAIAPVVDPASGEVSHYVGVQSDVTARRQSEDTLIDWLSRLDVIFTLNPDAVVCFDHEGTVSFANAAAESLFAPAAGALIGSTLAEFRQRLAQLADPAQPFTPLAGDDLELVLADAPLDFAREGLIHLVRPQRCTLHQSFRKCGTDATSLVIYFRNVTREVDLDRMKSDFLATAAHELRTPMASIMGFSELLMMRSYSAEKTRELLGTIHNQAQRLTGLLNDLLDLARIEARRAQSFQFEPLALGPLLEETLSGFLVPAESHRLVARIPQGLPSIRADRAKFQQTLLNLLSNARKFSPRGGDIEVDALGEHPDGLALVGIAVRDHGIGMNAEELAHAFERFYRGDRSGHIPGTGLGLSLVKEIMKLHGGSVSLESTPDAGTCVTLWFPVAAQQTAPAAGETVV